LASIPLNRTEGGDELGSQRHGALVFLRQVRFLAKSDDQTGLHRREAVEARSMFTSFLLD